MKSNIKYLIVGFVVTVIFGVILISREVKKEKRININNSNNLKSNLPLPTQTPSATISDTAMDELKIEDLVVGTGAEAVSGKKITVNYSGTLLDGTKFDSSYDRGIPFSFNLGMGEVIEGWDKGFSGMKIGGKRKLTIPASLGYGAQGAGNLIPPNATLVFEVELLEVE